MLGVEQAVNLALRPAEIPSQIGTAPTTILDRLPQQRLDRHPGRHYHQALIGLAWAESGFQLPGQLIGLYGGHSYRLDETDYDANVHNNQGGDYTFLRNKFSGLTPVVGRRTYMRQAGVFLHPRLPPTSWSVSGGFQTASHGTGVGEGTMLRASQPPLVSRSGPFPAGIERLTSRSPSHNVLTRAADGRANAKGGAEAPPFAFARQYGAVSVGQWINLIRATTIAP
ncbi:hypothetical protein WCLP8_4660010 [uncultured Gammaproteobacteria bacterium]